MQIDRVQIKRQTWRIAGSDVIDDSTRRKTEFTVGQNVDAELGAAMQALKGHALDFIGGPEEWDEHGSVVGLSVRWEEGEMIGAVVSLTVPVEGANGPLNLATPYALINGNSGLPKPMVAAIDAALAAAMEVARKVDLQHELFPA